jgi:hypothetical protein
VNGVVVAFAPIAIIGFDGKLAYAAPLSSAMRPAGLSHVPE